MGECSLGYPTRTCWDRGDQRCDGHPLPGRSNRRHDRPHRRCPQRGNGRKRCCRRQRRNRREHRGGRQRRDRGERRGRRQRRDIWQRRGGRQPRHSRQLRGAGERSHVPRSGPPGVRRNARMCSLHAVRCLRGVRRLHRLCCLRWLCRPARRSRRTRSAACSAIPTSGVSLAGRPRSTGHRCSLAISRTHRTRQPNDAPPTLPGRAERPADVRSRLFVV